MSDNIYDILSRGFPLDPDAPFLLQVDGQCYSYGELDQETARYANVLAACGLRPGDRVAAQVDKSAQAVFLYLGCVRAGLAYVPINPECSDEDLDYFLNDSAASMFVCRPALKKRAQQLTWHNASRVVFDLDANGHGSLTDAANAQRSAFATVACAAEDLAAIMYTSGTTGRSKGAMLSHGNLSANALVLHTYWGFVAGDVILHMLPIYHTHGLFVAIHCALLNGSALLFEPRFDARRALRLMERATVFMGVPPHYAALLNESALDHTILARMRLFISGSAPLLASSFQEFRHRTGHTILERYGMTEGGMLVSNPLKEERRCGTVGLPLPGTRMRVVDGLGKPLAANHIGHVQVAGPNLFSGYWRMPEKTREEFTPDGFFKTGDVGRVDEQGYLTIIGRYKDVIHVGGQEVYPKEIETAIDRLPGVTESAVIGLPDATGGSRVAAVIARTPGQSTLTAAEVTSALQTVFAAFKIPKTVHFVDQLPRNGMGKVQKNLLRSNFPWGAM